MQTAVGEHRNRPLVMVRLIGHVDGSPVEGWGECAALADSTYDAEDAQGAFIILEGSLIPALIDSVSESGGLLPRPADMAGVRRVAPGAPLGFAALEMAVADAHLRVEGRSLAHVLGVEGHAVPIGTVVGQFATVDSLVAEAARLGEQGFTRIKMKIGPGWDVEPLEAVSRKLPGLLLQADANGSYARSDIGHLCELDRFGLLCLEQPFDRGDLDSHRLLAHRIDTPVCLDESIESVETARHALSMGACSVICVKPSRLGGLGAALDLVQACTDSGIPLWMGGMFETGYARGINTTVAALPGFAWAGDLTPAHWYLEDDPAPGPDPIRSRPGGALHALPPGGPGLGSPPDLSILERHTVKCLRFEVAGR